MTAFEELLSRRALLVGGAAALALMGCRAQPEPLPELGKLGAFRLTDQEGRSVTQATLQGSVWVAAFMFTRCPTVCPKIMQRMAQLQKTAKAKRIDMKLVCFSVDPEFDTPQVLKAFGERYGADFRRWTLLTGDAETIQKTVVDGFKVGLEGSIDDKKEHLGITHGSHLVLVDRALNIRGYYRSSDEVKTRELLQHAARLAEA